MGKELEVIKELGFMPVEGNSIQIEVKMFCIDKAIESLTSFNSRGNKDHTPEIVLDTAGKYFKFITSDTDFNQFKDVK